MMNTELDELFILNQKNCVLDVNYQVKSVHKNVLYMGYLRLCNVMCEIVYYMLL